MEDSYRHKGMRRKLINALKQAGISNEKILEAFNEVPRHLFLDLAFVNQAYSNTAFQIGAGQTISHPHTVAFQTDLLKVERGHRILEIGTGSGFQTSILCALGARVVSIERQRELFLKAKRIIHDLGYSPKLFYGDGYKGQPSYAPYDSVIVTCGAPFLPEVLKEQVKPGGRIIIPIGDGDQQIMTVYEQDESGNWEKSEYGDFSFVPMLEKTAK
jgi:protein-L-isoaspartate(D-aspartate) O-methyltransferase